MQKISKCCKIIFVCAFFFEGEFALLDCMSRVHQADEKRNLCTEVLCLLFRVYFTMLSTLEDAAIAGSETSSHSPFKMGFLPGDSVMCVDTDR